MTQIAAARTFTIYEDTRELLKTRQESKAARSICAVVIRGDKIISRKPPL